MQDCVEAPNGVALCYAFRTDNSGPPVSTDEIIRDLDTIRAEFPLVPPYHNNTALLICVRQASVFASSYDAFIADILPVKDQLPVYTQEIGAGVAKSALIDVSCRRHLGSAAMLHDHGVIACRFTACRPIR